MSKMLLTLLGAITIALSPSDNFQREVDCLAQAVYHEARGEGERGKIAVAMVTLNRVKHPKFPDTVCDVVFQPNQYAWTKSGRARVRDREAWDEIRGLAQSLMITYHVAGITPHTDLAPLDNALFFSANGFKSKRMKHVATIGAHKFYSLGG